MAAVPVTAQAVGHAFVNQYYNVLHQWPHMLHKFYTNASHLTRAQAGPDGIVICAMSQPDIHRIVTSIDYGHCKAEIVSVDSSESMGGSVLVLVTGIMQMHQFKQRRSFVQNFLLAPQERGYYVLNDTLRYLEEDAQSVIQVHKVPNGTLDMFDRLQIGNAQAAFVDGMSSISPSTGNASKPVVEEGPLQERMDGPLQERRDHNHTNFLKLDQTGGENRDSCQMQDIINTEMLRQTEQSQASEELHIFDGGLGDKRSYASILRVTDTPHPTVSSVVNQEENVRMPYPHQPNRAGHYLTASYRDGKAFSNNESAEVKGVYIKNLPSNVTVTQVEDDLVRVGCSRPSSVILKNHKDGGAYAFVDFEDSESALSAIEASPVMIGGKRAYIEERKSNYIAGRGRGRGTGRGAFSSDGARANGSHISGTLTQVVSTYGEGDSSTQGRGTRPGRGGSGGLNARA